MSTRGVVVGVIQEVRKHPGANRLHVAIVEIGDSVTLSIVFGGTRALSPGDRVPVAPPGSRVPGKGRIRRRRYRGEDSFGMLCSLTEIGWMQDGPDEVAALLDNLAPGVGLDDIRDPHSLIHESACQ
jgi:tRNA-binding EMAP/Myf-like protein